MTRTHHNTNAGRGERTRYCYPRWVDCILCVAMTTPLIAMAGGTLDLNGLTTGTWYPNPPTKIDITGGGAGIQTGYGSNPDVCRPNPGNPNDMWSITTVVHNGENNVIFAGQSPTPGMGNSIVTGIKLLRAGNNDTGWRFSLRQTPGVYPIGNPTLLADYRTGMEMRVDNKPGDLTPGETYHLDMSSFSIKQYDGHPGAPYCYSLGYSWPFNTSYWERTQADLSQAQIDWVTGLTIPAGLTNDGAELGVVSAHVNGGIAGQTIALRWDGGTWAQGQGAYTGDRYNIIKNATSDTMTVELDCGQRNGFVSRGGGGAPGYVYSDTATIACSIVKAGEETIKPGQYPIRIQAAVRTP